MTVLVLFSLFPDIFVIYASFYYFFLMLLYHIVPLPVSLSLILVPRILSSTPWNVRYISLSLVSSLFPSPQVGPTLWPLHHPYSFIASLLMCHKILSTPSSVSFLHWLLIFFLPNSPVTRICLLIHPYSLPCKPMNVKPKPATLLPACYLPSPRKHATLFHTLSL